MAAVRRQKTTHVVLTLAITIRREDIELAKDALMDALEEDFDAIYTTTERPAKKAEVANFARHFDDDF